MNVWGEKMEQMALTTTIPYDLWKKCKDNGWKWQELMYLGIAAKENNPQLVQRIREVEEGNDKLQKKLSFMFGQIEQLEAELGKHKNEKAV
jgi:hypothetical protein